MWYSSGSSTPSTRPPQLTVRDGPFETLYRRRFLQRNTTHSAAFFEIYKIYDFTFLRTAPYSKSADFFVKKRPKNVGILPIFVEIGHFRSDFDENLAEFREFF